MEKDKKEALKKKKEEIDAMLGEKEYGKLKDLEHILTNILEDIKSKKPIDNKEEFLEIRKAIENLSKIFSTDVLVKKFDVFFEEFSKTPKKEYTDDIKKLYELLKSIKIENYKEELSKIERTIKEVFGENKPKDYSSSIENLKGAIEKLLPEIRKIGSIREVSVSNFPEQEKGFKILQKIFGVIKAVLNVFITNKKEEQAISVRLVDKDGKHFYNAQMNVQYGGTGNNIDLAKLEDNTTPATTPTIYNVAMATANTEYSKAIPAGTRIIDIKIRSLNAMLKIAFTVGESGSNYITIPFGGSIHIEGVKLSGKTVYIQSPTALQICEIICWS